MVYFGVYPIIVQFIDLSKFHPNIVCVLSENTTNIALKNLKKFT